VGSELVSNVLSFINIAELVHRFAKKPPEILHARRSDGQDTDYRHCSLLRHAGKRPKGGDTADNCKEIATPYSINSMAMGVARSRGRLSHEVLPGLGF